MEIRRITGADVDAVARLYGTEYAPGVDLGGIHDWMLRCTVLPWECCVVAVEDGRVLGFAIGSLVGRGPEANAGELEELYVVPEARGRGVGRGLTEAIVEWLRSCGSTRPLRAVVGHEQSDAARRILASLGFERHAEAWGNWVT